MINRDSAKVLQTKVVFVADSFLLLLNTYIPLEVNPNSHVDKPTLYTSFKFNTSNKITMGKERTCVCLHN